MERAKYAGQPEALLPLLLPGEASEILEVPLSQMLGAMTLGDKGFTFRTVISPDYAYERTTKITAGNLPTEGEFQSGAQPHSLTLT